MSLMAHSKVKAGVLSIMTYTGNDNLARQRSRQVTPPYLDRCNVRSYRFSWKDRFSWKVHPRISMHADNRGMHHMSYLASNKMTNALSDLCLPEILVEYRGPLLKFSGPSSGRGRVWNGVAGRCRAGCSQPAQPARMRAPRHHEAATNLWAIFLCICICSWWCQYMG